MADTHREPRIKFIQYGANDGKDERPQVGHQVSGVPGLYGQDRHPVWGQISRPLMAARLRFWHQVIGGEIAAEEAPGIYTVSIEDGGWSPVRVPLYWDEMTHCAVEVVVGPLESTQPPALPPADAE